MNQLKDRRIRISQHVFVLYVPRVAAIWGVDLWRAKAVTSGLGSVLIAPSGSEHLILCDGSLGETSQAEAADAKNPISGRGRIRIRINHDESEMKRRKSSE